MFEFSACLTPSPNIRILSNHIFETFWGEQQDPIRSPDSRNWIPSLQCNAVIISYVCPC